MTDPRTSAATTDAGLPPAPVDRLPLPERSLASRLVVVMRGREASQYPQVIDTLAEAGVRSFELTLTTPGTLDALPGLVERFGAEADLGVGTITTPEEARRAADGGAAYLVTPVTDPAVIAASIGAGTPIVPGGLTPTELFTSWRAGASAVKVFPAGTVGPGYVKDLHGPFPDLRVIPSGGVDLAAARAWLDAGADAVSVGGPLLGDAFRGGDLGALADRAREFVGVCTEAGR
ncbi:bifunctional 4-hydroxy-2-oxoglutarate aldolase/2-dehydro-3-deoxy-phosphogluconate aldolase [Brachybacterium halotolerans subsp. kimchii]|uniref:bifunctional 4-hydroxy-2-oxoglutarate aldolase/2-dehydro-3-deoxy-phosphogluconate aldolase n=1 Tax=Brachybacterium halotolerans TaxID=2795215 RepID=UPI001E60B15E|nr:bifunctional 4-hydroxy-2-oxoglutarate aldolase/2-dehydro-3-deoxy-phosphogluconate aldolase [Brachybacterium halotolerans]UEJ81589.1 bifunctional 4-hydroxy-2-oxoglutarate aldolase/2-dehydro-3-deoxy-phosphogluconate aldolase [Brachybacterium halotolerans subsp. kimchii]